MRVEWALVADGRVVVATADDAWVHRLTPGLPDAFASPMAGRGSLATTRALLDGAIGAAALRRRRATRTPRLTPLRWAWRLAGYHRTTEATTRLLPEAERRFERAGQSALAAWARMRAREEHGHDRLARRDIAALGYDPDLVLSRFDPPGARSLVEYFTRCVLAPDPIGCVGYAYALERLALEKSACDVAAIQATLPPGVHATRCLRVHSAAGSDVSHVAETLEMVARLPPRERAAVARTTYETARLFYRAGPGVPTDRALRDRLFTHHEEE